MKTILLFIAGILTMITPWVLIFDSSNLLALNIFGFLMVITLIIKTALDKEDEKMFKSTADLLLEAEKGINKIKESFKEKEIELLKEFIISIKDREDKRWQMLKDYFGLEEKDYAELEGRMPIKKTKLVKNKSKKSKK